MEALLAGKCGRRGLQTCRSWFPWYDLWESCLLSSLVDLAADLIFKVLAASKYSRRRYTVSANREVPVDMPFNTA